MSGTFQLLAYVVVTGLSLGFGLSVFHDASLIRLLFASLFWLVACGYFAGAFWIASWGKGRETVDRIGIAITATGFAIASAAAVIQSAGISVAVGFLGLLTIFFGRIMWELALAERSSP